MKKEPTVVECPECNGDGLDGSYEAALYYADRGELSHCDACNGTGLIVSHDGETP